MRISDAAVAALEARVAEVCGQLNALHGSLIDVVAEVIATDAWVGVGFRSPEHWVTLHTGVSPTQARHVVRLARRGGELAVTLAAVRDGELAFDQAAVVAAHVPAHNDAEACELARQMAVGPLRSCLRRYGFAPDPPDDIPPDTSSDPDTNGTAEPDDPTEEGAADTAEAVRAAEAARAGAAGALDDGWVSAHFDERGRYHLHAVLPTDDGLILDAALAEARDWLFHHGQRHASTADALVELALRSATTTTSASRADRFRVYVHLDTEGAWVNANLRLPATMIDSILSDGVVRPVWTTAGHPVNIGRASRIVPDHTRRLVHHRDHGMCRMPGCASTLGLDVHHVAWYQRDHGPTDTPNLMLCCRHCHRLIHRGDVIVTGNADLPAGLAFSTRDGRPLVRHPQPRPPSTPPPSPRHRYRRPTGERLQSRWVHFTPPRTHTSQPHTGPHSEPHHTSNADDPPPP